MLRRSSKPKTSKTPKGDPALFQQWGIKHVLEKYHDPELLIVDIRGCGVFRGGPPANPKEAASDYHQGHLFLALNLNLSNATTPEEIQHEITTGASSAGGAFLDTLALALTSDFHFLFYDQDGSGSAILTALQDVVIDYHGESLKFPADCLHWVKGGYGAIHKSSTLGRYCADTKTLLGFEEEIEEPEYSQVMPHLFVGGAVCSDKQYVELKEKGVQLIINVSNVRREPDGFECVFLFADDDQVEQLSRLFREVADLIESAEKEGKGVYVHCQRGLSRSPTLVMAYLMVKKGYDLRSAYELVKEKRSGIGPRSNFMAQLCKLEERLAKEGQLVGPSNMKFSLPMQVYELSYMRCANYEDGVQFLLTPTRKPSRLMGKYRDLANRW